MYQRILVPLDSESTAQHALHEAIGLAKVLSAKLHLVFVLDELNFINPEAYIDYEALREVQQQAAEQLLAQALAHVTAAGLEADSTLLNTLTESIEQSIDDEAVRWGADLIIMGTHGRSGLDRLLFGSVAEGVVRHAPVPVLLIRQENP